MIPRNDYLETFENHVQEELLRLCTSAGLLNGVLLATDDIDNHWHALAPEYMADAVPQVKDYPTVSVAWAAYLGLGVAWGWDQNWDSYSKKNYQSYYGKEGFDDMDEHIIQNLLKLQLDGYEAKGIENIIRRCGETTVSLIRHEGIEPQSTTAFHVFARACRVMFRIGAAIELKRLGYRFEKMDVSDSSAI